MTIVTQRAGAAVSPRKDLPTDTINAATAGAEPRECRSARRAFVVIRPPRNLWPAQDVVHVDEEMSQAGCRVLMLRTMPSMKSQGRAGGVRKS